MVAVATLSREALYTNGQPVLPGGDDTAARVHQALGRPRTVSGAEGAVERDPEGRSYLDIGNSHSAMLVGHSHPAIRRAIEEALDVGVARSHETVRYVEPSSLTELFPCAEVVRFAHASAEATWQAIGTARAFTGKGSFVTVETYRHNEYDYLGYSAWSVLDWSGPREAPGAVAETVGVPADLQDDRIVPPFSEVDLLERLLRQRNDEIAAVILEPTNDTSWTIVQKPGYLEALRELTRELSIVLTVDELVSGFRPGRACARTYAGVTPDRALESIEAALRDAAAGR